MIFHDEWLKQHCRRIFLSDLMCMVSIGIHDFERQAPQRFVFNISVYVLKKDAAAIQDDIQHVVDYDFIRDTALKVTTTQHFELQETLGDRVAEKLLKHPSVCAVRIATHKPDVYPDCAAVGIETFHTSSTMSNA